MTHCRPLLMLLLFGCIVLLIGLCRIFGFCIIFTLSSMVQAVVYEKQKRIKEGTYQCALLP